VFGRIIAADISSSHLALARESLEVYCHRNVDLVHINSFDTLETLPEYDAFISVIVLQHNPPPLIAALLSTILRKLKPGGFAYFQVPTYRLHYSFKIDDYLRALPTEMEMHCLPQYRVFEILHQNGCRVLECREDGWTGIKDGISNSFFAIKEA
jgi:SAM-dependent methyltransferase